MFHLLLNVVSLNRMGFYFLAVLLIMGCNNSYYILDSKIPICFPFISCGIFISCLFFFFFSWRLTSIWSCGGMVKFQCVSEILDIL